MTADVELADVRAATASGGEEKDDVPLLLNSEPSHARPGAGRPAGGYMHPRPNASYTRDGHSWASKLVFSWVGAVLDKVRSSAFPVLLCCVKQGRVCTNFETAVQSTANGGRDQLRMSHSFSPPHTNVSFGKQG